jgi:osmotically-inducible protein OsmY
MNGSSAAPREEALLDDDELQELIEERLDDDPSFHLRSGRRARFEVEVDDGAVTLRGLVRTAVDRRKADIVARALGATTVDNRLRMEEEDGQRDTTPAKTTPASAQLRPSRPGKR